LGWVAQGRRRVHHLRFGVGDHSDGDEGTAACLGLFGVSIGNAVMKDFWNHFSFPSITDDIKKKNLNSGANDFPIPILF
jgi:hypothetical protein